MHDVHIHRETMATQRGVYLFNLMTPLRNFGCFGVFFDGSFCAPLRLPLRSAHEYFFFQKYAPSRNILYVPTRDIYIFFQNIEHRNSCRRLFWKKNHFSAYYEAKKCVGAYIGEKNLSAHIPPPDILGRNLSLCTQNSSSPKI